MVCLFIIKTKSSLFSPYAYPGYNDPSVGAQGQGQTAVSHFLNRLVPYYLLNIFSIGPRSCYAISTSHDAISGIFCLYEVETHNQWF